LTAMHISGAWLAAFAGAAVEWTEAATIVLAIALTDGWPLALGAAGSGLAVLAAATLALGPLLALGAAIRWLRLLVGIFLLLMGVRWLAKSVARSAGLKPLHDESAAFARTRAEAANARRRASWIVVFKAVVLEGVEVCGIVIALGYQTGAFAPLAAAAAAALVAVAVAAFVVRGPLTRVPENTLKFAVGTLLLAFGTYWTGEAVAGSAAWEWGDLTIPLLAAVYAGSGWLLSRVVLQVPRGERA